MPWPAAAAGPGRFQSFLRNVQVRSLSPRWPASQTARFASFLRRGRGSRPACFSGFRVVRWSNGTT